MAEFRAGSFHASSQICSVSSLQAGSHTSIHRWQWSNIATSHEHHFNAIRIPTGYYTKAATVMFSTFSNKVGENYIFLYLIILFNTQQAQVL